MNGGKDCEAGDERQAGPVQVPIGWQRKTEHGGGVIYISPSGSVLSSLEQVKTYLLTDGTCKCGLECPLILHKVFNFSPGTVVKQRTAEDVKADEDVTKLCIHKRKLLAVATLHKSIETHPPLTLTSPGGGTSSVVATHSTTQRAIRTKLHDGLSSAFGPESKNPFKMMIASGQQQRLYAPQETGGVLQPEVYPGYPRQQRLNSSEPGTKSPYRAGYGGMLSPPPSSARLYADGSQSPSADTLASPEGFPRTNPCGFPGAGSPSSTTVLGNTRMHLSPPGVMLHGSPAGQPSCAMTGRTSTPLSPTATAKSPVMNMPRGTYPSAIDIPRAAFHHKTQPPVHPVPPPPCTLQKRQLTSEKDPLGILDPIPSKPVNQAPTSAPNPSNFQPSIHSQVPMMNVNIPPPAIVPLPSNLPLPTVKPGPVGHSSHIQRTQQAGPASMSPSPVTSPVHMAGPAVGRIEVSPHRSRSSSTSSEHGNFAMPSGHQAPCGTMKVPPRSPRSAMGSPRPAMPSSPSSKTDPLHQYKDSQLLSGMGNSIGTQQHSNPMYSPTSSSSSSSSSLATPSASQKGHPGLLGMPLNQILNQQNAASFPASSLLSAAAKAQLANQNKLVTAGNCTSDIAGSAVGMVSVGTGGGSNGGSSGHPGSLSGPRSMEGHGTLNPMLPPNSTMLLNSPEGQSGRAALRDKLMAQQRDPLRKRKQPSGSSALNHDTGNNMVYNMLNKPAVGVPHMPGPSATEQLRKVGRIGNLPPNTSMAQLLQSMSCQSSHNMTANNHRPGLSPGSGPGPQGATLLHYDSMPMVPGAPQQNLLAQQRLRGPGDTMQHCQSMDSSGGHLNPRPGQFPDMIAHMQASSMSNCGPVGPDGTPLGRPNTNPPPLSHPSTHSSQQSILRGMARTNMVLMPHGGSDGGCPQAGDTVNQSSLGCSMATLQPHINSSGGPMYQQQVHQGIQQGVASHPAYQSQQHFSDNPPYTDINNGNALSIACLYQNYQQGMLTHPQFGEGQPPPGDGLPAGAPVSERIPGGGTGSVDAIYRAVVDAASKGMHVTITTTVSGTTQASPVPALSAMSAFTASIGEPVNLPQAVSAVLHGHQEGEALPQQPRPRQARPGQSQKPIEPGKNTPDGHEANDYFRSPGRGTPRGQWDGEMQHGGGFDTHSNNSSWGGEEFLECSTQVRSSPCMERPTSLAPAPSCPTEGSNNNGLAMAHDKTFLDDGYRYNNCNRTPANYKERLEQTVERCAHINGATPHFNTRGYGEVLGPPRQELTGDDQSPSSSTSLEGPLATAKDYSHYNGHFNGMAPSPSDTKSLSSEEDLRQPDSPSSELLHYRSRTFNMGELVWGQLKGFPPWPAKLAGEEQVHSAALQLREQAKLEPEKLKTLTHDLEAFDRAAKRSLNRPGKLNNHLEAAIHEAMSELDKMSGSIPPRDRQVKLPKPKRRKISR
ncbi:methyl-CpG-binding domain protein 5-like isoform X2 [Thalassophryne amazonica]|uniref:methyl-CpG-binding domain protein 5-like isoform X2 n=1 Tax=Thalassophryne amazonica TaxID=390379 RepID=UPI0014715FB0|nr:methyl-CpG-binding domain protein 5-like isoform X2 [Thalassophryne amazonica]